MSVKTELDQDQTTRQPQGIDRYPEHHALWHLDAVGVFDQSFSYASQVWDDAEDNEPVTVALIDTPVAWDHPCLVDSIDLARMVDFSVEASGVFPVPRDANPALGFPHPLSAEDQTARDAVTARFPDIKDGSDRVAVRPAFSAHATAMAGLIGGRPATVEMLHNARFGREGSLAASASTETLGLPYSGVNPFCRIVPISTTSDPDPAALEAAFAYAAGIGAKVIVFATALIPPDAVMHLKPTEFTAGDESRLRAERDARQSLEDAILEAAKDAWVLCAAGNSGANHPDYPASLSAKSEKIVSVGSVTSDGTAAPYSSTGDIWAPSGDEPGFDRSEYRDDPHGYRPEGRPPKPAGIAERDVSVLDLVATDVPGPYGYNPSDAFYRPTRDGHHLDIGSLFCRFSGTSGAVAVAAGALSLAIQARGTVTLDKGKGSKPLQISDF